VKAYGMPSEIIDGNDVMAVYRSAQRAVDRAREGGGPTFIEAKTFRMRGHAAHDNQSYVAKEVLDQWRKRDPIAHLEKALKENKVATGGDIEQVEKRVTALLDEDLAWAEAQPSPLPEDAMGGVYDGDVKPKAVSVGSEE
jgi:pyruvate dehydrogenase E1 component alpha subunit